MNLNNKNETIKAVDWVAVFPSLRLVKCGREALEWRRMWIGFSWVVMVVLGVGLGSIMEKYGPLGPLCFECHNQSSHLWPSIFVLFFGLFWTLLYGGAISRVAAIGIGTNTSMWRDVKVFLDARWGSLLGAAGLMLLPFLMLGGLLVLGGATIFGASWLAPVGAVLFGVALLLGIIIAFLAVLETAAATLLIPAIAVDGNDGFDAPGRAISYVLARPWQLALHLLVLAFFGAIFIGLALGLEYAGEHIRSWLNQIGSRHCVFGSSQYGGDSLAFASSTVSVWKCIARSFVLAYAFSFLFSGLTRIYLLIRESADGVPETEIWHPSDDKKVTMGVEDNAPKAQVEEPE